MKSSTAMDRRPIKARETRWAGNVARWLAGAGFRPNAISLLSILFACLAGACLLLTPGRPLKWQIALAVVAALGIELRLLCNLFDGMVAIEGGFQTRTGAIFNELPDRISDSIVLVCAGYAVPGSPWFWALGWAAALLAMLTAYLRVLGGAAGASQPFIGPMAKQQRMHLIAATALLSTIETALGWPPRVIPFALILIVIGCLVTVMRRTLRIVKELSSESRL